MKPLTKEQMYKRDKNGNTICILPKAKLPNSCQDRSKYDPRKEDKKHRGAR